MALTGELTDLSLAELIEFFCNQRKTGRLKVVYPIGPGYFYLQSGSVVHARIGVLRGIEAVYYALTLRNASFTFSPAFEAPEVTINQPWTSVVLEGLRRMDEGIVPANPFPDSASEPVEEVKAAPIEESVEASPAASENQKPQPAIELPRPRVEKPVPAAAPPFLSQVVAPPSNSRWKLGLAIAAVILVVAVIAVPWGWYARSNAARLANETKAVAVEPTAASSQPAVNDAPATPTETEAAPAVNSDAADLAKRQREARLREAQKERALENAGNTPAPQSPPVATKSAAKEQTSTGSQKKVTVTVTYDENGRVTQASGGDATALRIARQKRFPPGKPGSATITIPIN